MTYSEKAEVYLTSNISNEWEYIKSFEILLPGSKILTTSSSINFRSEGAGIVSNNFFIGHNFTTCLSDLEVNNIESYIFSIPKSGSYSVEINGNKSEIFTSELGGLLPPCTNLSYHALTQDVDDLIIIIDKESVNLALDLIYDFKKTINSIITIDAQNPKQETIKQLIEATLSIASNFPRVRNSLVFISNIREICTNILVSVIAESFELEQSRKNLSDIKTVLRAEGLISALPSKYFTILQVAKELNISARNLQLVFKKHRDYTPMQFLREKKLDLANKMFNMAENDNSVKQVALSAGITDLNRFSKYYFQKFGELPSDTLKRNS